MKSWHLLKKMSGTAVSNSWYVAMHLDRLNDELLAETYGKREEQKKSKFRIEIINSEDKKTKL